ncbi:hypothetical protein [Aliihoeflea sp. PC F10.4]
MFPAFLTILVFVLIGPPAGAMVLGFSVALLNIASIQGGPHLFMAAIFLSPFGYLAGGLQALLVGGITGTAIGLRGYAPLWLPLGAAFLTAIIYVWYKNDDWYVSALMMLAHLIPAGICWLIVRRLIPRA